MQIGKGIILNLFNRWEAFVVDGDGNGERGSALVLWLSIGYACFRASNIEKTGSYVEHHTKLIPGPNNRCVDSERRPIHGRSGLNILEISISGG